MALSPKWREKRLMRGLSLQEAAELLGITKDGLSKIERGDNFVKEETLEKACEVYNCQPGDLYIIEEGAIAA